LIPEAEQSDYTEQIAYLPDSYQATDNKRSIDDKMPTRSENSLPEDAFVYCCFNNAYKLTPDIFSCWMRILQATPQSVLWLLKSSDEMTANLQREAETRGVTPERLIFAERATPSQHLARHRLADLFLDTRPYNAHTTGSDALWA